MQNLYGRIRFFLKIQIWMHPDPQQRNFFLPFVKVNLYFFSNFRSIFIESYAMKSINLFLIFIILFFWLNVGRWRTPFSDFSSIFMESGEVKNINCFLFSLHRGWKCMMFLKPIGKKYLSDKNGPQNLALYIYNIYTTITC